MMFLEPGFLITLVLAVIGGIVWAVRIEGRVNGHQTLFEERDKQTEDRYVELNRRIGRVEMGQDHAATRQERYESRNEK